MYSSPKMIPNADHCGCGEVMCILGYIKNLMRVTASCLKLTLKKYLQYMSLRSVIYRNYDKYCAPYIKAP